MQTQEGTIRFGDNGEFILEDIVEELDASGERVTEAVIFFSDGSIVRGISLALELDENPSITQSKNEDYLEPVRLRVIDPQSVMQLLEQPTATLVEISQPISDD